MPDVEGGIFAARKERPHFPRRPKYPTRLGLREVFSAGLGSPALRQAGMPAATNVAKGTDLMTDSPATVEPKQLRDLHIELKVKQPTPAPVPKA